MTEPSGRVWGVSLGGLRRVSEEGRPLLRSTWSSREGEGELSLTRLQNAIGNDDRIKRIPTLGKKSDKQNKGPLSLELIYLYVAAIDRDRVDRGVGDSIKSVLSEMVDDKVGKLVRKVAV